jgi:tetratricopeptide (TPR) repeat protein
VALVLHLSVDWDWDMAAVSVAVLLIAGVAAAYVRGGAGGAGPAPHTASAPRGRFGIAARVFATGLLVLAAASWTMPYVAERAYDRSVQLASEGRLDDAAAAARRAHRFDPLAADPLLILSLIQQQQGDTHGAQASIDEAIRLQPQNYEVYLKEGQLELNAYGRKERAAAAFRHARALNPLDSDVEYYLQLSESR